MIRVPEIENPTHSLSPLLLPSQEQTLLLRACLLADTRGYKAWELYQFHLTGPRRPLQADRATAKWLQPLLYYSLNHSRAEGDENLRTNLRAAYLYEELRSTTFRDICRKLVLTLHGADVPVVILRGAALAGTVYKQWAFRHCHDVDFWVDGKDQSEAVEALTKEGFRPGATQRQHRPGDRKLTHASGLQVALHDRLFLLPYYDPPAQEIRTRVQAQEIAGVAVRCLAPVDALLHVLGHAACSGSRDNLQWVCDAWHILNHHPEFDWDLFESMARKSRVVLPVAIMLDYLVGGLEAPVPSYVLDGLRREAAATSVVGIEAVICGARAGTRGQLRNLWKHTGCWKARMALLKWLVIPCPDCLQPPDAGKGSLLLPLYYAYRPVRYFARRIRFALDQGL